MLSMVLEGIKALSRAQNVTGFILRDVRFLSALVVPTTEEGIEAQLHLQSHNNSSSIIKEAGEWDFWIYTVSSGDEWRLHCTGNVWTERLEKPDLIYQNPNLGNHIVGSKEANLGEILESCPSDIDSVQFYKELHDQGAIFGPSFQTLQNIHANEDKMESCATVAFGEWKQRINDRDLSVHIIHPSTLDSLFQLPFASVFNQRGDLPTMIPTEISEIYISMELQNDPVGYDNTIFLHCNVTTKGMSNLDSDITALNRATGEPLITFRGFRLSGISNPHEKENHDNNSKPTLFHQIDWKPDISLLSSREIEMYCHEQTKALPDGGMDPQTEIVCRYFLSSTITRSPQDVEPDNGSHKDHVQRYIQWARSFLASEHQHTSELTSQFWPAFQDDHTCTDLISEFAASLPGRKAIADFGKSLKRVLDKELDPLDLLFNEGIVDSLYQSSLFSFTAHRLAAYMDLLSHKASAIRILEIGAGTGSTTTIVLETLARHGRFQDSCTPRFEHYDFTDISPSFFSDAQERYSAYDCSKRMRFKRLDIERDPEEQGFEANSYDIVIAVSVRTPCALLSSYSCNLDLLQRIVY